VNHHATGGFAGQEVLQEHQKQAAGEVSWWTNTTILLGNACVLGDCMCPSSAAKSHPLSPPCTHLAVQVSTGVTICLLLLLLLLLLLRCVYLTAAAAVSNV
jgi:hypothetical protein